MSFTYNGSYNSSLMKDYDWWAFISSFDMIFLCKNVVFMWNYIHAMDLASFRAVMKMLRIVSMAMGSLIFSFGGMLVGGVAGAMKGQTTETGLFRGAAIGAVSGAIVSLELLDSIFNNGHFLSKISVFGSIFNGKAFMEWVGPAVLKAYQWQASVIEIDGVSRVDIYSIDEVHGISSEVIKKLPKIKFCPRSNLLSIHQETSCTICLQELMEDERARMLPGCQHIFHLLCIDKWLARSTSCPLCRNTLAFEDHL